MFRVNWISEQVQNLILQHNTTFNTLLTINSQGEGNS